MGPDARGLPNSQDERKKLRELSSVAEQLILAKNIDDVAETSTSYALTSFNAAGGFWEYDTIEEKLDPVTQNRKSHQYLDRQPVFEGGRSLAWEFFMQNKLDYYPDLQSCEELYNPDTPFKSEVFLPIDSHGLLILAETEVQAFSSLDIKILELFQSILISTMERLNREQSYRTSQDVYERVFRHNIRNRLNVIKGAAETAKAEQPEGSPEAYIQQVIDASSELCKTAETVSVIQDVIRSPHRKSTIDIVPTIENEVKSLQQEFDFAIETNYEQGVEVTCHEKINEGISELMTNGVVHNTSDDPKITIHVEEHKRFASVLIEDNGPGIPEHELDVIRNQRETKLKHGSGVGLWLADRVARHSGGTLMFDVTDYGTTAEMIIPY